MEIRLARRSDAKPLAYMSRSLIESGLGWSWRPGRLLRMIDHPEACVIKAVTQEHLVGFAVMEFQDLHCHLNLLAVEPAFQRQGVARELLDWLTESARTAGIERIDLEVRCNNSGAVRFYKRQEYAIVRRLPGYYRGQESAYRMSRQLIPADLMAQRP